MKYQFLSESQNNIKELIFYSDFDYILLLKYIFNIIIYNKIWNKSAPMKSLKILIYFLHRQRRESEKEYSSKSF